VDEHLTGRATSEGIADVGVYNVGKLILVLREALDVLSEGLV
jgi:hypothetical protein